jgi:hypothetical protein
MRTARLVAISQPASTRNDRIRVLHRPHKAGKFHSCPAFRSKLLIQRGPKPEEYWPDCTENLISILFLFGVGY